MNSTVSLILIQYHYCTPMFPRFTTMLLCFKLSDVYKLTFCSKYQFIYDGNVLDETNFTLDGARTSQEKCLFRVKTIESSCCRIVCF